MAAAQLAVRRHKRRAWDVRDASRIAAFDLDELCAGVLQELEQRVGWRGQYRGGVRRNVEPFGVLAVTDALTTRTTT
eukprot:5540484-Prymnesium_polylepis.1